MHPCSNRRCLTAKRVLQSTENGRYRAEIVRSRQYRQCPLSDSTHRFCGRPGLFFALSLACAGRGLVLLAYRALTRAGAARGGSLAPEELKAPGAVGTMQEGRAGAQVSVA